MRETDPWWLYRARPRGGKHRAGVVDGDTLGLMVDVGFGFRYQLRARLSAVDTAETWGVRKDSEEYAAGMVQAAWVETWLSEAMEGHGGPWPLIVRTEQDSTGKYGRYMATVARRSDGERLCDRLIEAYPEVSSE